MKFLRCFLSLFLVFCMILPPVCLVQAEDSGLQRIFYDDFEQYAVGDTPSYSGGDLSKWTTIVRGTESPVAVMEEAGNKMLSLGRVAEAKEAAGPRAEKVLPVGADAKIRVHCKVKTNSQVFQLSVRSAVTTDSTTIFNFSGDDVLSRAPAGAELSPDAWISLTFELDCRSMKYTSYINGYTYMRNAALNASINFDGGLKLRFGTSVQPGTAVYLDEVEILSDDSLLTEGKLLDIFELRTDSDVLLTPFLRQSHPRIYVSDFDEVKEKIRTDQLAAGWYASVKASADTYLQAEPEAYAPESGILTNVSRRIMYKLYVLAFVYAIEEDPVYKQRAIEEIVNADQFPSWHPNNFLGVAELGGGVAVAYDWMYNGMTETERETVRNVILNKTLYLGALSYEGISDTFFVTATSNWNFVCNGGLVLSALAISDEYPLLADYIFNKAADSLPYATGITFAPEGASPEGPGYWEYAAYNFVDMIAALESAVDDGKTMPDKFDFSDTVGLAETLDFPIATHSTVGRFNYGDNVPAYGSPIDLHIAYWMAKKYNKPEYAAYQMQTRDLLGNYGMPWKTTLKLIWYDPYGVENRDTAFPLDKAYSNENGPNIISLRSSWAEEGELYVGMQGGLNGSAHSFLSLGTFVLDAMGERWATLIGQGNYRWPGYFDMESQRWTYYNCNTEGQNCVVLNADAGPQQNISALARTVDFKSSDDEAYGVLDLTAAYESTVSDYKRGVKLFDGRSRVLIQDDISAKEPLESGYWFMHTDAKVYIEEGGKSAMLIKNGKRMYVQLVSDFEDAVLSLVPAKPLPTSQNPEIQQAEDYGSKLSIDLSGAKNIKLGVLFTPLEEGQTGADEDFQLVSIGDWGKAEEEHAAGSGGSSAGGGSGAAAAATVQTDSDAEIMHNVIALYINSPLAYRNGERLYIDSGNEAIVPMLEDGRTLVPLRFIAESLGAQVQWDQEENAACITYHNSSLVFVIDSKYYTKNGRAYPLDTAARLYGDRTYVPVRAVMEAFGKHVAWNDGLVTVSSYASIGENQHVIESLTQKLAYRLYVNGAEIGFFDLDQPICDVVISPGRTEPSVILLKSMNPNAAVHVVQPSGVSGSGTVAVDGKEVQVRISVDPYYYAAGEWGLASINVTNAAFKDMTGIVTWLQPLSVTASAEGAGAAEGICDNSLDTFWSSQGANTVDFDMGEEKNITSVAVSGDHKDGTRRYRFSILYSNDGIHWETAAEDLETTGPADDPELFELENFRARYIRFSAQGNTVNEWNIFYEVRFYESDEQAKQDEQNWEDYFARIDWDGFKTGDALRLAVSAVCNNGETVVFQAEDVLCTSDRADVIMTDGTLLQAVGAGMANITVTVDYHGIKEHVNIAVQVTE